MLPLSRRISVPRPGSDSFAAGNYLTDGERLFRVVSPFVSGSHRVAACLEDCMTLEVEAYEPEELYAMALRPVRVAGGPD